MNDQILDYVRRMREIGNKHRLLREYANQPATTFGTEFTLDPNQNRVALPVYRLELDLRILQALEDMSARIDQLLKINEALGVELENADRTRTNPENAPETGGVGSTGGTPLPPHS